jgi:hypothetical protein
VIPASKRPKAAAADGGKLKQRHLGKGQSLSALSVVKIWNRSVETVVAETPVEAYAVSPPRRRCAFRVVCVRRVAGGARAAAAPRLRHSWPQPDAPRPPQSNRRGPRVVQSSEYFS